MRERILRSATELFSRKEFHQVVIDEVAALAGVGKGSIYRQFGSKEALYAAAVIDGFSRLQAEIRAMLGAGPDLRADLTAIIRLTLHYFWDRREFFTLMHDPAALPPMQARRYLDERQELSRLLGSLLAEGARRGFIRKDLDTRLAAESLLGMIRGINRYCRKLTTPEKAADSIVTVFLEGCAPRQG
jgi:AcrR family transcriptional regulator